MARTKNHRRKAEKNSALFPRVSLPLEVKRITFGMLSFALALIALLAFFEKAGSAGNWMIKASSFLLGRGVIVLPLIFSLAGVGFLAMRKEKTASLLIALLFFVAGLSGILGTLAKTQDTPPQDLGGVFGLAFSMILFSAFGFWVSAIVFASFFLIAGLLFWNVFPHEKQLLAVPSRSPAETLKKVFAPKFEVSPVETEEPKVKLPPLQAAPPETKGEVFKIKSLLNVAPLGGAAKLPPTNLLDSDSGVPGAGDIKLYSAIIKKTFQNFAIPVEVSEVNIGPTVTQYAIKPSEGIKLSRITGLNNDLALALAAHPIRIEAPIPGRALVGIEVPNRQRAQVRLRSLIESEQFRASPSPLLVALGRDVSGNPMFADLARMPHLLIAGATGTGKTIGLNNLMMSLLYRNSPHQLRLILVDPKRVEFPVYNDLPHLLTSVIYDTQRTLNTLKWLIKEMERRFEVFSQVRARDIRSYHAWYAEKQSKSKGEELEQVPYIVLVIDELADLMAARGKELEGLIVRLVQMARAVGIHLVLATQRPSVEVITGLIKANITARIAFQVASQVDSRTILDCAGSEKLLGLGDMLFISAEAPKPKRIQGAYVSDKEVKRVSEWIKRHAEGFMQEEVLEEDKLTQSASESLESPESFGDDEDPLYGQAKQVVVEYQKASASLLQRRLKIGYARAARLLDILESRGVVGPGEGAKPREVYIKQEEGPEVSEAEMEAEEETRGKESRLAQPEQHEQSRWFSP